MHELNLNLIYHQGVRLEFHQELFVIQQRFDHDKQHLHPDFTKKNNLFLEKYLLNFTFPLFNSSNEVGICEYSRGAPYKFIQQGPNVGRKP
jgi:hypothetical protein